MAHLTEPRTWTERLKHASYWRREVKRSFGDGFTHVQLVAAQTIGRASSADENDAATDMPVLLLGLGTVSSATPSTPPMSASSGDSAEAAASGNAPQPLAAAQTLVFSEFVRAESGACIEMRPLVNAASFGAFDDANRPSSELTAFFERTRSGSVWSGVLAYSVHEASARVLLTTSGGIFVYAGGVVRPIARWGAHSEPLAAAFCPHDADWVSFCSRGQLYIDHNGDQAFTTASDDAPPHVTNGLASFVVIEELQRDEGYWWSPTRLELLYERVDESEVTALALSVPGTEPAATQTLRYPLAGTRNATSTLHLATYDTTTRTFATHTLPVALSTYFADYEYIARVGWAPNGECFYVWLLNRAQTKSTFLVVRRDAFSADASTPADALPIRVIYTEESPIWINLNNATFMLEPGADESFRLILGSEKSDIAQLYLYTLTLRGKFDESQPEERCITEPDCVVINDVKPTLDTQREHIYYAANYKSTLITSLCVSTYNVNARPATERLTPFDLSYKCDRSEATLNVCPDFGFTCWLSSLCQLPECHFYALIHGGESRLPTAEFRYRIRLAADIPQAPSATPIASAHSPHTRRTSHHKQQRNVPSAVAAARDEPMSPASPPPPLRAPDERPPLVPTDLFEHAFHEVALADGTHVHALVLLPAGYDTSARYPVIHFVYAGPGLQLVRDSWVTVSQVLKFLTAGYAIFMADTRGSCNRGIRFEGAIKHQLGAVEVEDQTFALCAVAKKCPQLDLARVGVSGWSYGGYMALNLLAARPDLYVAACAGAAVIDWSLYDTAYTERYMGVPDEHADAYRESSITAKVAKLPAEEDRLLVVHGLIDDNVHFHHTTLLLNALINAGKPHKLLTGVARSIPTNFLSQMRNLQIFPREHHGVKKSDAVEYLHASMLAFFDHALKMQI